MRYREWFMAVLMLFTLGCGGGTGSGQPRLDPANLVAVYDPANAQVTLTWTAPGVNPQGYNLEVSSNGGAYQQINTTPIQSGITSLYVSFTVVPPEATTFTFRLQAVYASTNSAWSNEASIRTGLNGPSPNQAAYDPVQRAVLVTWLTYSQAAVQVRIERSELDANGNPGTWITLATQSAQTLSYSDASVQELARYAYRLTNLDGSIESQSARVDMTDVVPLFAPQNLVGNAVSQGIQLSWQNLSTKATAIEVVRAAGLQTPETVVASLDPHAQGFLDTSAGFGSFTYLVRSTNGIMNGVSSSVVLAGPNPPGALTLVATTLGGQQLLSKYGGALRPDGVWALAAGLPLQIQAAPGLWPKWQASTSVGVGFPAVQLDDHGYPLLLNFQSDPQNAAKNALVKVAFDGTAWQETTLVPGLDPSINYPTTCFWRTDGQGGVCGLLTTYGLVNDYLVASSSYLRATSAGVQVTPLSTLFPPLPTPKATDLFVDSTAVPHFLFSLSDSLDECWPAADGTWNTSVVLSGSAWANLGGVNSLSTGSDSAWLMASQMTPGTWNSTALVAMAKVGGVWMPPQTVYSLPAPSNPGCADLARSADGTRVAALVWDQGLGIVVLSLANGQWIPTLVAPPNYGPNKLAFDAANHLHVLLVDPSQNWVDFHE